MSSFSKSITCWQIIEILQRLVGKLLRLGFVLTLHTLFLRPVLTAFVSSTVFRCM